LEDNKAIALRFRKELWEEGGLACLDEAIDPNCLLHVEDTATPVGYNGPQGMAMIITAILAAADHLRVFAGWT
jgi:hypothetical protein